MKPDVLNAVGVNFHVDPRHSAELFPSATPSLWESGGHGGPPRPGVVGVGSPLLAVAGMGPPLAGWREGFP